MPNYSDQEIIEAIREGGQQLETVMAFIYNESTYRKDIFRYVLSRGGSQEDAEDVFQDGIRNLIICIRKGQYRGESSVKGYLFGVCKNLWFKQFNKQTRHSEYKSTLQVVETDGVNPEILIVTKEREEIIDNLLGELGPACKKVLTLWRLSYSMKEIAAELGYKSDGVARKKKHQCFQGLLKIVHDNPDIINLLREKL
ncbi:MAG: sigma-70 family RNA polymerase sigma factor [Bacteroidota bacterium]